MQETTALILDSLRLIKDTRVNRTKRHSLELLLFVAVCAYLCGYEGFNEMELFAGENQEWLRTGLGMSGVPSRDTFNRGFQAIGPAQFGHVVGVAVAGADEKGVGALAGVGDAFEEVDGDEGFASAGGEGKKRGENWACVRQGGAARKKGAGDGYYRPKNEKTRLGLGLYIPWKPDYYKFFLEHEAA